MRVLVQDFEVEFAADYDLVTQIRGLTMKIQ
jgi:hypothetical protein